MFEKLIDEHGSSAILRERLELYSEKYDMLEEKNKHLSERNKELESKLKQSEEEINRLKSLFDTNQSLYAAQIARQFNLDIGTAEYHINNLLEAKLIHDMRRTT